LGRDRDEGRIEEYMGFIVNGDDCVEEVFD